MAITSGFFNSVNGDRRYKADFFAEYFASFISNGVFPNPSTGMQVIANGNMTVSIRSGKAWIKGYYANNDADYLLSLGVADGVLKRIDRIVLRLDFSSRQITPAVKKGIAASSPTAPSLQRDADAYELGLADVLITNGAISISQANITDNRLNTVLCGIVHGVVDQVDTTTIFNQYQAWFNEFSIANQSEFNAWKRVQESDYTSWSAAKKNEFDSWFTSIQDILSGDVAGNLLNKIAQIESDLAAHQADDTRHIQWLGLAGGTANTLTASHDNITSYKNGLGISFATNGDSSVATFNINNLGPIPIKKSDGENAELKTNGVYTLRYLNGNFILQGEGGVSKTGQISNLKETVGFSSPGKIQLDWTLPPDNRYKGVVIRYKEGSYPKSPTDGSSFFDSNDASNIATATKTGFIDGVKYYMRAFAYTYNGATRVYTDTLEGACTTAIPIQTKGMLTFTTSSNWTVPHGVTSVEVFIVGGGGSGSVGNNGNVNGGGGAGGYTKTYKSVPVTPNEKIPIVVGSGGASVSGNLGAGNVGGSSSFKSYTANGGEGAGTNTSASGGSGGGSGWYYGYTGTYTSGSGGSGIVIVRWGY